MGRFWIRATFSNPVELWILENRFCRFYFSDRIISKILKVIIRSNNRYTFWKNTCFTWSVEHLVVKLKKEHRKHLVTIIGSIYFIMWRKWCVGHLDDECFGQKGSKMIENDGTWYFRHNWLLSIRWKCLNVEESVQCLRNIQN